MRLLPPSSRRRALRGPGRTLLLLALALGLPDCSYFFPSCQTIPPCPVGQVECTQASCADLTADPQNCGACNNVCAPQEVCLPLPDGGAECGCSPGTLLSDGHCVDVMQNLANCGAIGAACASGQVCLGGRCGCPGEDAGLVTSCPVDGGVVCTELASDDGNCGACGVRCNAAAACQSGACLCQDGQPQCGASCCAGGCADGGCLGLPDAGGDGGTP